MVCGVSDITATLETLYTWRAGIGSMLYKVLDVTIAPERIPTWPRVTCNMVYRGLDIGKQVNMAIGDMKHVEQGVGHQKSSQRGNR